MQQRPRSLLYSTSGSFSRIVILVLTGKEYQQNDYEYIEIQIGVRSEEIKELWAKYLLPSEIKIVGFHTFQQTIYIWVQRNILQELWLLINLLSCLSSDRQMYRQIKNKFTREHTHKIINLMSNITFGLKWKATSKYNKGQSQNRESQLRPSIENSWCYGR